MLGQKGHCTSSDLSLILIKMERVTIGKKGKWGRCCCSAGAWAVLVSPAHSSPRPALGAWPRGGYRSLCAGPSSQGELVPSGEQGTVGLTAKTVLGFTPPFSFSCKHPGLVHRQLEARRRGVVYAEGYKLICSSPLLH